ncbi:MAG TPA: Asp23/Gls24 family envelope stress response protein [Symbiobacteriaceae bacterium]|nr:Asp23/Gls24 family envelope stress response protein [Symbiobacteriaceae bacterium]
MDVIALVGPAGSGKSHRAGIVAHQHQVELIIDDGLLIREGKIIAGSSAKREDNKMAAVRRAIFHEQEHREEVRSALWAAKPKKVLVLGTSDDMIERICDALDLPHPEHVIRIEEIASPAQIRLARRKRLEGKHVIPAPTFEVKKTFSGYMVDPLRFFLKRDQEEDVPMEKSVVRPTFSSLGRFFIADTVIAAIATRSAEMVDGVGRVGKVVVESRREGVLVEMEIVLRYGCQVWDVLTQAQTAVAQQIEHMTALNVIEINLDSRRLMVE